MHFVPMTEFNELIELYRERDSVESYHLHYEELDGLIEEKINHIRNNAFHESEMSFDSYQSLSRRTMPTDRSYMGKLWILNNYGLGLTGEAGEVADLIKKKVHHGHDFINEDDFKKELGDVLHYLAGIATLMNISFGDVAIANIQKLKERYPDGFNTADSIKRADTKK